MHRYCVWLIFCCIGSGLTDFTRARAAETATTQSLITSWNLCSRQFIDPPVFTLLPLPEAAAYRAEVTQGDKTWAITSEQPALDLKRIWKRMGISKFQLKLQWLNRDGEVIYEETGLRVKAPDFKGFKEEPADWAGAADRNIASLIRAAEDGESSYREPGVPVWIWSSAPNYDIGYPSLNLNYFIWAFLGHVENKGPYEKDAMRLALATADWGLKNHTPDSGKLPNFPYSSISKGKYGGSSDGEAVNLLRASALACGYVDLYAVTRHRSYLDYARHIADTTMQFQNPDGSFPYRIDPQTGAIVEMYNSNAMEFIELVEKLEAHEFDARRAMAARRAVDWLLSYVCATNNWKAVFEDVTPGRFYENLSQMGVHPLVRYLCRHKDVNPTYLPTAIHLNRWVEDQFVTFGLDDEASPVRVIGPLVFEQYNCWRPMDSHTGNWIRTLVELHKATGNRQYLDKAMAAANAICRDQFPNGEFSTWGRDYETGKTGVETIPEEFGSRNWYAGNASASMSLYKLTSYVRDLKK